ncbi:MAG: hypothetical protein EBS98_08730 [Chitinophagia bacterium]|nr:hypothetical protein [Chitinophagia bacterium]
MIDNRTIIIEDCSIDFFKNGLVSSRPFLIRLYQYDLSYNYEVRLSREEMIDLSESLKAFVENTDG